MNKNQRANALEEAFCFGRYSVRSSNVAAHDYEVEQFRKMFAPDDLEAQTQFDKGVAWATARKQDLALVAKAGKAIGLPGGANEYGVFLTPVDGRMVIWNPIDSEIDQLRLMQKAQLIVDFAKGTVTLNDSTLPLYFQLGSKEDIGRKLCLAATEDLSCVEKINYDFVAGGGPS